MGCVLLGCPAATYALVVSGVRPHPLSLLSSGLLSCLPSFADFVSLPLLSPRLRRFCGLMRVGGYPQDGSSFSWGSTQGRGFVCGLCSAGLPCCQVCTSCLWGPPSPPLLIITWTSLLSPLFCGLCVSPSDVSSFAQISRVDAGGGLSSGWLIY